MGIEDEAVKAANETLGKLAGDIYGDVARPAARQVGTALETVFKVGLSPVSMLDWGFQRSKEWLTRKVEDRLAEIPEEFRQPPPALVAVPVVQAIALTADEPMLREMYAELLLNSMDGRASDGVHPSFVGLLGQLSPSEALLLNHFWTTEVSEGKPLFEDKLPNYFGRKSIEAQFRECCGSLGLDASRGLLWLENLHRLKIVELLTTHEATLTEDEESPQFIDNVEYRTLILTEFGRALIRACTVAPSLMSAPPLP